MRMYNTPLTQQVRHSECLAESSVHTQRFGICLVRRLWPWSWKHVGMMGAQAQRANMCDQLTGCLMDILDRWVLIREKWTSFRYAVQSLWNVYACVCISARTGENYFWRAQTCSVKLGLECTFLTSSVLGTAYFYSLSTSAASTDLSVNLVCLSNNSDSWRAACKWPLRENSWKRCVESLCKILILCFHVQRLELHMTRMNSQSANVKK